MLSTNFRLFRFLLDPTTNQFSDEYIHFKIENNGMIQALLEMMVVEYANKKDVYKRQRWCAPTPVKGRRRHWKCQKRGKNRP